MHAVADYFQAVADKCGDELGVDKARRFSTLSGYKQLMKCGVEAVALETPPYFFPGHALAAVEAGLRREAPERFTVLVKGRLRVLAWSQVSHLRTENRLLFVATPEGRFVLDRTLDELEAILAPRFLRIHRGAMVRLDAILELEPDPGGTGELLLRDGARLPVSRERMPELRARIVGA